jgi:hypothetical protein
VAAPIRECCEATLTGADGVVRLFLTPFQQRLSNGFQNCFWILKKNSILKSDYLHSVLLEKLGSFCIVIYNQDVVMRRTIKFDNYATFRTVEVDDVGSDALLSPKLFARKLSVLEMFPQYGFSSSAFFPEFSPTPLQTLATEKTSASIIHGAEPLHLSYHPVCAR